MQFYKVLQIFKSQVQHTYDNSHNTKHINAPLTLMGKILKIYTSEDHCINSPLFSQIKKANCFLILVWIDLLENRTDIQWNPFDFSQWNSLSALKKAIILTLLKVNIWNNSSASKLIVKVAKMIGTTVFWFTLVEIQNHDWDLISSCVWNFLHIPLKFTYSQIHKHVFIFTVSCISLEKYFHLFDISSSTGSSKFTKITPSC